MNYNPSHDLSLKFLTEPRRNNYFYGKLLDVPHLRMEQDYGKLKQWLLNRLTVGYGVLCGLRVVIDKGKLCVDPGVALDTFGREIIVPGRFCIDPFAPKPPCEKGWKTPTDDPDKPPLGPATLWLCYRECLTDFAPVAVSECPPQDRCEAGTIIETFKFRISEGVPRGPAVDPKFCATLLKAAFPEKPTDDEGNAKKGPDPHEILCKLIGDDCAPPEGDGCIPIATFNFLRDRKIDNLQVCSVRPRVYSNAVLLELILCLMGRIEECCGKKAADTLRITAVTLLGQGRVPEIPLKDPKEPLNTSVTNELSALRVKFNMAVDKESVTIAKTRTDVDKPSFLVAFQRGSRLTAVLGDLSFEAPDTVLYKFREPANLVPGNYLVRLYGDADTALGRPAITEDKEHTRLDGEPKAYPSGDDHQGGIFEFTIVVTSPR